jgi:hypothetical protein
LLVIQHDKGIQMANTFVPNAPAPKPEPYVYQHFPLWVTNKLGKRQVVKDENEYESVTGRAFNMNEPEPAAPVPPARPADPKPKDPLD